MHVCAHTRTHTRTHFGQTRRWIQPINMEFNSGGKLVQRWSTAHIDEGDPCFIDLDEKQRDEILKIF